MEIKKTLLINPILEKVDGEPAGVLCIASYLRSKGEKVEILDLSIGDWKIKDVIEYIKNNKYDVVGFSVLNSTNFMMSNVTDICKGIKEYNEEIFTVCGGIGATVRYNDFIGIAEIDAVCIGEGEVTMYELISALRENKKIDNISGLITYAGQKLNKRCLIEDLDVLPFMSRDTLEQRIEKFGKKSVKNYQFRVYAGRGCFGNCTYCANIKAARMCSGRIYRQRSIGSLVEEIKHLYEKYGATRYIIWDDNFLPPGKKGVEKAKKLANQLKDCNFEVDFGIQTRPDTVQEKAIRILKQVGLKHIFIGVENADEDELKLFNRRMKPEDIRRAMDILFKVGFNTKRGSDYRIRVGYIGITPYSNIKSFYNNVVFCNKYDIPIRKLTLRLLAFHGTEIRKIIKNDDLLVGEFNWEFADSKMKVFYDNILEVLDEVVNIFEEIRAIEKINLFYEYGFNLNQLKESRNELEILIRKEIADLATDLYRNPAKVDKAEDMISEIRNKTNDFIEDKRIVIQVDEFKEEIGSIKEAMVGIGFFG